MRKKIYCEECDLEATISFKHSDITITDIIMCPVCGADISSKDDEDEDE